MADKKIINVVYAPGKGPPKKMFENEKGEVWNSNRKDPNKINKLLLENKRNEQLIALPQNLSAAQFKNWLIIFVAYRINPF